MSSSSRRFATALLFIAPALWSINYLVAREAVGVVEPHALALMRWVIAFLIMLPFAWRELGNKWPDWKSEWKDLLVLGGLGMWICGAFVYLGGRTTFAVNIALLYALAPVLIAAASALWFHEKLRLVQWLGAALALFGMLLVVTKASWQSLAKLQFTPGDAWILAAVLSWTVYSLMLKNRRTSLGVFARSTAITLGGIIVLIPFTVAEWASFEWLYGQPYPSLSAKAWLLAVLVALFPGLGAYQAYAYMQKELGAAKTGLVLYLGPLYGAIAAWIWLGEQPRFYHLLGAMFILPGIYLATQESKKLGKKDS